MYICMFKCVFICWYVYKYDVRHVCMQNNPNGEKSDCNSLFVVGSNQNEFNCSAMQIYSTNFHRLRYAERLHWLLYYARYDFLATIFKLFVFTNMVLLVWLADKTCWLIMSTTAFLNKLDFLSHWFHAWDYEFYKYVLTYIYKYVRIQAFFKCFNAYLPFIDLFY